MNPKARTAWLNHQVGCLACGKVQEDKSSTFANLCVQGASLFKDQLPPTRKARPGKPDGWVSKDELRRVTRYVGE